MHFSTSVLAAVASAATVSAASVTFWTLDNVQRTIYFTPSPGHTQKEPVVVNSNSQTTVDFPANYEGNFYAVPDGSPNVPGMLGEVLFGGFEGMTFFDVSAIVNPDDHSNVKQMWPASSNSPMSGCEQFPCSNAYYLPNDVQTKVTDDVNLMTSLGSGSTGLWE